MNLPITQEKFKENKFDLNYISKLFLFFHFQKNNFLKTKNIFLFH
jgi:hypothetical protein